MEKFPHLPRANGWPGLDHVDPFALEVEFDPYVWKPGVEIHLVATRLDAGYQNIVGWESVEARDDWYDQHSDKTFVLDSEFHVLPGATVKLPIPFTTLNGYNQLFIEYPDAPVEYAPGRPYRFYYFITDIEYRSPSTTACIVTLDEWTTHGLEVQLPYIRLQRGHAPMAAITPAHYLESPAARCGLLSIPDRNFGGGMGVIKHTAREVLNQGTMWCVLTFAADLVQSPGTYGTDGWHTPTTHGAVTQGAMGYETFAIDPNDFASFMDTLAAQAPQVLSCIIACFLVPAKYLQVGGQAQYLGHTITQVIPQQTIKTMVDLEPSMFGYPDEYKDIAKLYTAPYSWLEIVDDAGRTQSLRVEDTNGHIQLSVMASIAYPLIGLSAYVLGIGGGDDTTLQWQNFNAQSFRAAGDWTKTLREFAIPTYAILIDPMQDYDYRTFYSRQQAADSNAEAMRLSYAAAQATRDTVSANLARQQARLAQQQQEAQDAADLSDDFDEVNVEAQLHKLRELTDKDKDFMTSQTGLAAGEIAASAGAAAAQAAAGANSAQVAYDMQVDAAGHLGEQQFQQNVQSGIALAGSMASGVAQVAAGYAAGAGAVTGMESATIETAVPGGVLSQSINTPQTAGMTGGISGGIANAGGLQGAVAGAADIVFNITENHPYQQRQAQGSTALAAIRLDAAQAAAYYCDLQYQLLAVNNQTQRNLNITLINDKLDIEHRYARWVKNTNISNRHASLDLQQGYQTDITNADVAVAAANADRVKTLADDGTATSKRLADASIERARKAAGLGTPRQITSAAGGLSDMTQPQIMSVRVRTQDIASIAAAGDLFLTYGYAFAGRQWAINTLTPMSRFSYWEGDVQIGAYNNSTATYDAVKGIFASGVMIWRDPDMIGATSIYDNRPEVI